MYKGKKYNFIVVGLLFIMAFVVGSSAGMSSSSVDVNAGMAAAIEEEAAEIDTSDVVIEGAEVPDSSASAFERLEYAFKVYGESEGRKSYISQTLTTMGQSQFMQFSKMRGGGLDLTEEFFNMPDALFGLGKNEVKITYSNGTDMYEKVIDDTSKFNYDEMTYKANASGAERTFSVYDYTVNQNRNPINNFFLTINEETATVSYYDKKARGKDYYTITTVSNTSKLDSTYLQTFYANGAKGVDIKGITFTFKINKETGVFMSFEKNETFYADYGSYGAEVETCYKETVLSYKSQESTIVAKASALGWS